MPPKGKTEASTTLEPSFQVVDHSIALSSIKADLNRHCLGSFRVIFRDMNFKWGDRDNRKLQADPEKLRRLFASMKNGLYRTQIRNRMSGIVERDVIKDHILSPDDPTNKISLGEVKQFDQGAKFPVIAMSSSGAANKLIEMQSGQHRMAVLRQLLAGKQPQWWWIVTLYDQGPSLLKL
jgi:hypothetical protein